MADKIAKEPFVNKKLGGMPIAITIQAEPNGMPRFVVSYQN